MCSLIAGKHLNKDQAFFNWSTFKLAETKPREGCVLFVVSEGPWGSTGDVTSRPVPTGRARLRAERGEHTQPPLLMTRASLLTADMSGLDTVAQAGVWIPSNNLHIRKGKCQRDFLWHFPPSSFSIIIVRNSRKKNTELSITHIPPWMRIGCVGFGLMIKVLVYQVTW